MRRKDLIHWETKRKKGKVHFVFTSYLWLYLGMITGLMIKNYLYNSWQWIDYIIVTVIYIVATAIITPIRWNRNEAKYFQHNK